MAAEQRPSHLDREAAALSSHQTRFRWFMSLTAMLLASVFLALGIWVTRGVEEDALLRSARIYAKAIDSFRAFYTEEVVDTVRGHPWVEVSEHYRDQPGTIPLPATLTIDLADYLSETDQSVDTRLVSDFPFPKRADRTLTAFEEEALEVLRASPDKDYHRLDVRDEQPVLRLATPILMQPACVSCHNHHPDSPKRDWQVGDVRGIQVVELPRSYGSLLQEPRLLVLTLVVLVTFMAAVLALFMMDARVRRVFALLRSKNRRLEEITGELQQQQHALDEHAIVSMTDREGAITYVNAKFQQISGYSEPELLGRTHRLINSGAHPAEMFEQLWQTILAGQVWHGEVCNINKAGEHYWVKATIMPLYNADGEIDRFISIRTDITHEKQLEAEFTRSNQELYALTQVLEQARLDAEIASEAKSAFLANMSHEIRTPMTGIIGMTDLALDTQLNPTQRGYLQVVRTSAGALLAILNDILDFSKIEAGKLTLEETPLDLTALICDSLKPIALQARRKGLRLQLEMSDRLPQTCMGDPVRIRQVLVNLCDNAVKFTAQGQVSVQVDWQAATGQQGQLCVAVVDQGIGIAPEKQAHIFAAFTQADDSTTRRFGGTGLGLSICARLVELMQGEIGVQSAEGEGSRFHFTLPLKVVASTRHSPPDRGQVLLLEQPGSNAGTTRVLLNQLGFSVASIARLVELESVSVDAHIACLVDVRFTDAPEALLQKLSALGVAPERCVLLSDEFDVQWLHHWQSLGVDKVITRPPRADELALMLATESSETRPAEQLQPQRSLQILVAEDNKVNQKLISTLLEREGHQVVMAENGEQAVARFKEGVFDLVLMDMQMPVMNGLEATRNIRAWEHEQGRERLPIHALSANVLPEDIQACREAGMDGHLAKPIQLEQLRRLLQA